MLNAEVLQIIHTWEMFHRPGYRLLGTQGGSLPLLRPLSFLPLRWLPIALTQILQPLRLRDLRFHLYDQCPELLLALLAGVCMENTIRGTKPVPNHLWRPRHVLCCTFLIHICNAKFTYRMIRAPPVLNFDFFRIQNKEDLRNGRQLLHNHQR